MLKKTKSSIKIFDKHIDPFKALGVFSLVTINSMSFLFEEPNILTFLIYLILSLCFINKLNIYIPLLFVVFTLPDYFVGGPLGIFSIQLCALIIFIIRFLLNRNLIKQNIIPFILILIITFMSFRSSPFQYLNGYFSLSYSIIFSILIMCMVSFEERDLTETLPLFSSIQLVFFLINLIINGYNFEYGLSINDTMNHNTFARAIALLGSILVFRFFYRYNKHYTVILCLALILVVLTGSRNGTLALIGSGLFAYFYKQKKEGAGISTLFKMSLILFSLGIFSVVILPDIGGLFSRFDYYTLVSSGGTNRVFIWQTVIKEVIDKYLFFGYGPSTYCSSLMVSSLVGRQYSHTHNTVVEAFGELGLLGLIVFLYICIKSITFVSKKAKCDDYYILILIILIDILINSVGEAMFSSIALWTIFGICYARKLNKSVININQF